MDFFQKAKEYHEYMKNIREQIHMYPELGGEEIKTGKLIMKELDLMEIPYRFGSAKTGIVGLIQGKKKEGKTILLRADMDALPIQECNESHYKSRHDGIMHACGHDVHTAMLLGAARILNGMRDELNGNIKLCFQPAEEASSGGAQQMVEEGLLENPKVDFAMALHVEPQFPIGSCGLSDGAVTAFPDFFSLTFRGKGGHGSLPHLAVDPIAPAAEAYTMLQGLKNKVDPLEPCVIQVCMFHAGTAQAVIPDTCTIEGTVRVFSKEAGTVVRDGIEKIAEVVCGIYGTSYELDYRRRCFSVINDEKYTKCVRDSVKGFYELGYRKNKDMGGEDFCFISDKVPSVYIPIGTANDNPKTQYPVHNPYFEIDDRAFEIGAATLAKCAFDFLSGLFD
ncbi:amidohydrolase [Anaerotignum faecicola]|nr:amidohydrolase [Anaerotignum faecicola]